MPHNNSYHFSKAVIEERIHNVAVEMLELWLAQHQLSSRLNVSHISGFLRGLFFLKVTRRLSHALWKCYFSYITCVGITIADVSIIDAFSFCKRLTTVRSFCDSYEQCRSPQPTWR